VIAGISTRLIDTQPHDIDRQINRALAELAELVHADRAYLVVSGEPNQLNMWCGRGITFPPSWPDRALTMVARLDPTGEGIVHIPSVGRLPSGADKDALVAAGLDGWACVSNMGKGGVSAVLGFLRAPAGRHHRSDRTRLIAHGSRRRRQRRAAGTPSSRNVPV